MREFLSILALTLAAFLVLAGCSDQEAKKELEKLLAKDAMTVHLYSLWEIEKKNLEERYSREVEANNILKKALMAAPAGRTKEVLMASVVELEAKLEAQTLALQALAKANEEHMRFYVYVVSEKDKGDASKLLADLQAKQAAKDAAQATLEQASEDVNRLLVTLAKLADNKGAVTDALRFGR